MANRTGRGMRFGKAAIGCRVDVKGRLLPMGLNIKNERVCALAKEAAAATHQSQTSVIEQALEQLLEKHRAETSQDERARRIGAILADLQRRWAETDSPEAFTTDDLYDENGLPA